MKSKKRRLVLKEEEEEDFEPKNVVKAHAYLNNKYNYIIISKLWKNQSNLERNRKASLNLGQTGENRDIF